MARIERRGFRRVGIAEGAGEISTNILSVTVARRYYLDGLTKSEIADELGISRFRVARILEKALADGLVKIVFRYPQGDIDFELSAQLQARLGLKRAVVVADETSVDAVVNSLGRAAAGLLQEICEERDVLGVAWTRAMEAVSVHLTEVKAQMVVQLCGVFPGAGTSRTPIDLVRDMARLSEGKAAMYYAPLIASDKPAADAIRRQKDVLGAHSMHAQVTKALIGIGGWAQDQSTIWHAVSDDVRESVAAAGAVAEMCGGIYLDRTGKVLHTDATELSIGISAGDLRAIPETIGIVFGVEKRDAVLAAVRGGFVDTLVTHASLAALLI